MIKNLRATLLVVCLLLCFNCNNEPYEGEIINENNACLLAIEATSNAFNDYISSTIEQYSLVCQNYKNALENQIIFCGDIDGFLSSIILGLNDCILDENLCNDAIALAEIAQENYENATETTYSELCNTYKTTLEYLIEVCGVNETIQSIIEDLGDCEPVFVDTIGTWKLISWLTDQPRDINNDGETTNDYLEEIDCYNNETIIFNSNGSGALYYNSVADITYTEADQSTSDVDFFVSCTTIEETKVFTWTQNGNSVVLTMGDGTVVNYFRNANTLFIAVDDGFRASSTIAGLPDITERVTYVYVKL